MKFHAGNRIVNIKIEDKRVKEININGRKLKVDNSIGEFVEFMKEVEEILKITNPELRARII